MSIGKLTRARRGLVAGALTALAALLALTVAPSSGASPTSVLVGGVPALTAGTHDSGPLAPGRRLSLTVVLRPRNAAALESLATAVSTPGSPVYRHYLGVHGFATRFGAAPSSVALVRRTLRHDGLAVDTVADNGLSLAVSGSVERISHAFGVRLRGYREASGRQIYANVTPPRVPTALAGAVETVLGLDDLTAVAPAGLAATPRQTPVKAPRARTAGVGGAPAPCTAASSAASADHAYTIDQIDHSYGIDGLYAQGDTGAGVTVALLEAETYSSLATDIGAFSECYFGGLDPNIATVAVDGGPSGGNGEETSVDIQNTLGVAPAASILIYQGPPNEQGIYATLSRIITDDKAKVIQDAWAECETAREAAGLLNGENSLLSEAALQGQSFLTSSGDRGSEGCQIIAEGNPNEVWGTSTIATELAVEDPAGQPFATGVGGSELTALGPPPTETVWNQFAWGSGGGGISNFWAMPAYQASYGVPGVINSFSSGAPCGVTGQDCREVPDVSASASTRDGYVIYYAGGWTAVGGTSTSTPVWAGLIALADASNANGCSASAPLGFLNPSLYAVAAGSGAADAFRDVTSGDNNPSTTGAYPATPGYDMATGLGTPIATDGSTPGLVTQLCEAKSSVTQSSPTITSISTSEAAAGTVVTILGSGFTPFARVFFGSSEASGLDFISATKLEITVPAGTGIVNVSVSTTAGTSTTRSFTYAPTASIGSPANGAGYTQGQAVSASYACAASTSGVPSCTGALANGARVDTSVLGQHQFAVTATDANHVSTTTTATYTVVAPPAVSINGPVSGATYLQGQVVSASFSCTSTAPVTVASCAAPVASGAAIDTQTLGSHSFTVTATDSNGFSTSQTASYQVVVGPQTRITTPANGAVLVRDASVHAVFTCTAAPPAQLSSCVGTTTQGRVDTSTTGTHRFTVTATDSFGVVTTTTVSYTVVAARPQITSLREAAARWIARGAKHGRLPVGTTFSFSLDQSAKVTLRFVRTSSGRLDGGRCVAAASAKPSARSCTQRVAAGAFSVAAKRGDNAISFSGHTAAGILAPGSYVVTLTAVGLSGRPSAQESLRFTVAPAG